MRCWQLTRQLYQAEIKDMVTVEGLLYVTPSGELRLHDEYINTQQSRHMDRLMEVWTAVERSPTATVIWRGKRWVGCPSR